MRDWVLKASRLCNLRCRYCYEWDGLSNPRRMDIDLWRRIFEAVRTLSTADEERSGNAGTERLIWHGGEPTLLPLDYLEAVMALQREIFPADWLAERRIRNYMQTNLYAVSDEKLDFFERHGFDLGVSFDVVGGVRVDAAGRPSEARVRANLDRLEARAIRSGMIVVIAGHTARDVEAVYAFLKARGRSCALLPLFGGPHGRPGGQWMADRETVNLALFRFFELWMADGCMFRVRPLSDYLATVVMQILGLRRQPYDRRTGDRIFVIGTGGEVHEPSTESTAGTVLGNLSRQTIDEVIASPAYAASLVADDAVREHACGKCPWRGPCSTADMFMIDDGGRDAGHCMTARPLHDMIASYLREANIGREELRTMLADQLAEAGTLDPANLS